MFKTFWTSVFFSLLGSTMAPALAAGEGAVVIRLARGPAVEAVFTATHLTQRPGELILENPRLYLPNPEQGEGFEVCRVDQWPDYTRDHPGEVALWRASSCLLKVSADLTRGLNLDDVALMSFSGDAVMEMGYLRRRTVLRAREVRLAGDRLEIPGPFTWTSERWSFSGSRAQGRLAHDAQGRLLRQLTSLVLTGTTEARGELNLPGLGAAEFTLTSQGTLLASVTNDKVGFRGTGRVEGREAFLRVTGDDPRGLLGPTGWHYLELESPRARYSGPDFPGGVILWGRYLYMEPRQVEISGDPVGLEGPLMSVDCAGVRWDRIANRIHCDAPRIRRRKPLAPVENDTKKETKP